MYTPRVSIFQDILIKFYKRETEGESERTEYMYVQKKKLLFHEGSSINLSLNATRKK